MDPEEAAAFRARRAYADDARGIASLVGGLGGGPSAVRRFYGSYNISQIIETSYLALTALGLDGEPAAFVSLSDAPPGSTASGGAVESWLEWFREACAPAEADASVANTLWVELLLCAGGEAAVESLVRAAFRLAPQIDYLILAPVSAEASAQELPAGVSTAFLELRRRFSEASSEASGNNSSAAPGKVFLCDRAAFYPTLAVRRACVEDHDDLLPVFEARAAELSDTYGEFFLADILASSSSGNGGRNADVRNGNGNSAAGKKNNSEENEAEGVAVGQQQGSESAGAVALAALVGGRARGLLAASGDVELGLLQRCFELECYENLAKAPENVRNTLAAQQRRRHHRTGDENPSLDSNASGPPHVIVLGPPGAGKTLVANALAKKLGCMLITLADVAEEAAEAGAEAGQAARKLLAAGEDVPEDMVMELLAPALVTQACAQHGWVLEGVGAHCDPEALEEAIVMATDVGQEEHVATRADAVLVLDLPDRETAVKRILNRRVDPNTGEIWNPAAAASEEPENAEDSAENAENEGNRNSDFSSATGIAGKAEPPVGLIQAPGDRDPAAARARVDNYSAAAHELLLGFAFADAAAAAKRAKELTRGGNGRNGANGGGGGGASVAGSGSSTGDNNNEDDKAREAAAAAIAKALPRDLPAHLRADEQHALNSLVLVDAAAPLPAVVRAALAAVEGRLARAKRNSENGGGGGGGGGRKHAEDGGFERFGEAPGGLTAAEWAALPPNAFAITLYCLEEGLECRAADLLPHAFSAFPDRDFCLVTLPTAAAAAAGESAGSASLLRLFAAAVPRRDSTFSHALYVLHRDGLAAARAMRVHLYASRDHRLGATKLLEHWDPGALMALREAEEAAAEDLSGNPPAIALVATLGRQVVGVAVADRAACSVEAVQWLKANFDVEDHADFDRHRPKQQARLTHLCLHPFFSGCGRYFLKEIMRHYGKTLLYYETFPLGAPLPQLVATSMLPVLPRQKTLPIIVNTQNPNFNTTPAAAVVPPPASWRQRAAAAAASAVSGVSSVTAAVSLPLHVVSRRNLCAPQVTEVSARVVVVGASTCGLAALQRLAFDSAARLINLTLVAPNATATLEALNDPVTATAAVSENASENVSGNASVTSVTDPDGAEGRYLRCLALGQKVRLLDSKVVGIDRGNRAVLLSDGSVVPYDVLALATGLQDDTPSTCRIFACDADGSNGDPETLEPYTGPTVTGFVTADAPAAKASVAAALFSAPADANVVVYGASPAALVAVQGLLAGGVSPKRILMVTPGGQNNGGFGGFETAATAGTLGHAAADLHAARLLAEMGVEELPGLTLLSCGADRAEGRLRRAVFCKTTSSSTKAQNNSEILGNFGTNSDTDLLGERVAVDCCLVVTACAPSADAEIRRAADSSGLVFDGQLVVNKDLRTADEAIFAGGTLTRPSRAAYVAAAAAGAAGAAAAAAAAAAYRHDRCNSLEMGNALAEAVLSRVAPRARPSPAGRSSTASAVGFSSALGNSESDGVIGQEAEEEREALSTARRHRRGRGISAGLPGGFHWVRCTAPSSAAASKSGSSGSSGGSGGGGGGGSALVTGEAGSNRFCVLRLDSLDRVSELFYYGSDAVDARALCALVGVHLSYLGGAALTADLEAGRVACLLEHLGQPRFNALRHDRFARLRNDLCARLAGGGDAGAAPLLAALQSALKNGESDQTAVTTIRKAVGAGGASLPPSTRAMLELWATDWVKRNRATLGELMPRSGSSSSGLNAPAG